MLAEAFIDGELATARADDPDAHADALDKRIDVWNEGLRQQPRPTCGDKDGEQLLERTKQFARSHLKLAKVVQAHGIGSRPDIVEAIAHYVFSTGWRGSAPELSGHRAISFRLTPSVSHLS